MRILFINPWLKTLFGDEKAKPGHPHLGIAYLISVLKQNGFRNKDIDIYDQGLEENDKILYEKIDKLKPDLIAMTTFSYCIAYADDLIKKVKNYKNIPIIIGGPHVSAVKKEVLEAMKADFAMQGESEVSFMEFLKEFEGSKDYLKVGNLIWRDASGDVIENEKESLIKDLDSIPFPSFESFEFEKYPYFITKTLPIITSRGCPYGCNYCSVKLSMGRGFRPRSPENVIEEMKHWIKTYGIEKFEVNDDCFSLDIERAEKICDLIIREGLNIKYEMYNGIRADRVTEQLLKKMKNSGCIFVAYGCESGNQNIVNNIGKALKIEKVREAVELANKIGIKNSVNFIVGHKGETYKTAMESVKFAKTLPTNFVNFYNIVPYPGTELYDWARKNASYMMSTSEYMGRIASRDLTPVFETKEFTKEERIKVLKKGYALYERTVLEFRLGKILGYLAYVVSRNRLLFSVGRKIALSNKIGFWIYSELSSKSRVIKKNHLKVVIINHNPKERGTYHRCYGFAKELVKKGHQVYFFCLTPLPGEGLNKYQECGIDFIELPWFSTGGFFSAAEHFFRGLYIFCFAALKRRVNIVHSFNTASPMVGFSTFLIFLIKRFKGIKLIVDWDDWWGKGGLTTLNHQGKLQEVVADLLETKIPLLADHVTLHNDLIKERALGCGVKPEKITKIYNGADVDAYKEFYQNGYTKELARQELNLPDNKIILFFGGAVVTSVPFLLRVVSKIKDHRILLIVVGPIDKSFLRLAEKLKIREKTMFKGLVNYDTFKKYLFASDILLLPRSNSSLLDRCTFPGRIGDYMLAGRPIVASDVGELSHLFREDQIGLLAKPNEVDDFKKQITTLIKDEKLQIELRKKAMEVGKNKYNWGNLTIKLLSQVYIDKK